MYTMGASEFHANVGHANKWSNIADSAATQWTLGYNYNLSKRTKVYGYYTKVNNSKGANYVTMLLARTSAPSLWACVTTSNLCTAQAVSPAAAADNADHYSKFIPHVARHGVFSYVQPVWQ
jgi:predicted porin